MRTYNTEGIVLKFTNFKDSDKIYTIFTRDKGKISVLAKGVRKISSKRAGAMDTLSHVSIGIAEQPNGYKVLTEAKSLNSFKNLKASLDNSLRGFYLAELVYKLLEEDHSHSEVFDLFLDSLKKLNLHLNNEISRINAFEIALMGELGYEMYLDKCAKSGIAYDASWGVIKFSPVMGGLVCDGLAPGISISKSCADLLYALKFQKVINKKLLSDPENVIEVDRLIKLYIKEVVGFSSKFFDIHA